MRPIRQLICAPGRIRPIIGLELGTTSFRALAARRPVVAHEAANIAIAKQVTGGGSYRLVRIGVRM
jgi:hypothetical protein